jgi:putative selenium metabolism protein SsnA
VAGTLLIRGGTVVTLGAPCRVLEDHAVVCRDGLIERVVPRAQVRGRFDRTIDAAGKVVMPGFINAHTHLYGSFARGLGKARPSRDFGEVLEHLWWRLDRKLRHEDCEYSALVALVDAVRAGTTTLLDHHSSPRAARGSLAVLARAVKAVGLRASLCYEVSDRDGRAAADDGLLENTDFIEGLARSPDPQLAAHFGLHASFTLGDRTLEEAAELALDLGVGCHVHVAEAESDQRHSRRHHRLRVVDRLYRFGVLGPRTLAAHAVHVSPHEMELLAQTGTPVVHNPQSNMNNAVGVADVPELTRRGVVVGLGTDAMTERMGQEVRAALWVRHLAARSPGAAFEETLATLLVGNARIASRFFAHPLGVLAAGHAADVVVLDYQPPTPLDAGSFLGHFAFGLAEAPVDTTVASGKVLMCGGKLELELDVERVMARARELGRKLWARF